MISLEALVKSMHYHNLLHSSLKDRDINKRWEDPFEKNDLARNVRETWETSLWEPRNGRVLDFNVVVERGIYKDKEPYAVAKDKIHTSGQIDILANLETVDDIHALRAYLDQYDNPQSTLATRFFPLERGDRSKKRHDEDDKEIGTEIILLRRELRDLPTNNIRRVIISNSHSPALAYLLLETGIVVVDVISLPGMFDFALQKGFFEDKIIIPVTGDDGAGALGELVEKLAGENQIKSENSIHAKKIKIENRTEVHFDPEQLKRIKGKTAVIPEDILATGGTLEDTAKQLIEAGAEEVIIMVSYPIFANSALEKFKDNPRIKIITTDGFTPQVDISKEGNIYTVSTKETFAGVLELDRRGVNFFMPQGKEELRKLGFCLNPWMDI
ncbi:MAG: phosphoribosyltransferase family protein [Patescibacteria group bacterium]